MDNVNIEIVGCGAEITVGSITGQQTNYIISHQFECNQLIPVLNSVNELTYVNWKNFDDKGHFYGSNYGDCSQINVKINGTPYSISNFSEKIESFDREIDLDYLMSINHFNGTILTYDFNVELFDPNKLVIIVKDIKNLYWGYLITGIEYDGVLLDGINGEVIQSNFENILIKDTTVYPIQKI